MQIWRFYIVGFCLLAGMGATAQTYTLEVEWLDVTGQDTLSYPSDTLSRSDWEAELRLLLDNWREDGYWLASVDSLGEKNNRLRAFLWRGPQFEGIRLSVDPIGEAWRDAVRLRDRKQIYPFEEVERLKEQLLTEAENRGFPFARVWVDSVQWDGVEVKGQLRMEPGQAYVYGPMELEGTAKISQEYLEQYLGIRPGATYRGDQVRRVRERLQELPFLSEKQPLQVTFREREATVKVFVERQKASRFDFLLGVLPTENAGPDRRFLITGTLNAELQNAFGLGERLYASFEQLRPGTQDLELAASYPYVLGMPFGVDLGLEQYRRDSTFNNLIFDAGVRYLFAGGNYLRAFWNRTASSLLSIDEAAIVSSRQLPSTLDVNNTTFGLEGQWQNVDYRFNPRRGWMTHGRVGVGVKRVEKNSAITDLSDPAAPEFDFESLYDTLTLQSVQYRAQARIDRYWPIGQSSTVLTRVQGGWISSAQPIYRNEQYRIGGNRLLRGFDEEQLFVDLYAVLTLEYRLLLDRNSNLYAFFDYGYVEDGTQDGIGVDRPFGLGAGLSFQTRAGLFGVSVAVGRQFDNPIDLRNPKVHFGYVNFF
jgi:outer membrane protein assembly factor BamA